MKKKSLKPIEVDAYFKYRCPQSNCGQNHWLTLKETQTKNFKIVCDCGEILKPKRIDKIRIKFFTKTKTQKEEPAKEENLPQKTEEIYDNPISERLLVICSKTLKDYGFTSKEAENLLKQSYVLNPTENPLELINNTLIMIGDISDSTIKTN
jgi:hypothetical protein